MKWKFSWRYLPVYLGILLLSLFSLVSCVGSQSNQSEFYNAGNADLSVTGSQFDQYLLFRFDTTASAHTLVITPEKK